MQIVCLLLTLTTIVVNSCPVKDLMSCIVQLDSEKVFFERNMIDAILNITSEIALINACRTYERVFPCFVQRMSVCGTKSQKSILEKGKALHNYLCAPYSSQRQQTFLKQSHCIQNLFKQPLNSKCDWQTSKFSKNLTSCRLSCKKNDALCLSKIDLSTDSICTFLLIESNCGIDAALFYSQIQQVITDREYPIQCPHSFKLLPLKTGDLSLKTKESFTSKPADLTNEVNPYKTFISYITVYPHLISTITTNKTTNLWKKESNLSESHSYSYIMTSTTNNSVAHSTVAPLTIAVTLPTSPTTNGKSSSSVSPHLHALNHHKLYGARPIPDTLIHIPTTTSKTKFKSNPYARSSSIMKSIIVTTASPLTTQRTLLASELPQNTIHDRSTLAEKSMHWYPMWEKSGTPNNPLLSQHYDAGQVTAHSAILPPRNTTQFHQLPKETKQNNSLYSTEHSNLTLNGLFHLEPTLQPPSTKNNRMDDSQVESPQYQNVNRQVRDEQKTDYGGPFAAVGPLFNQLKSHPLNLTDLSNQANNYFSAAINAITSAAQNSQNDPTFHNDPWRSFIDAVAPTIQRVSPDIIPRLRQEMERLEQK